MEGTDVWKTLGLLSSFLSLQLRRFQRSQREGCKFRETLPRELSQTCQKRWIYGDETQFLFQSCNCTVWVISPWENWWLIYRSNEWINDFGQLKTKFCSFASTMGSTHGVCVSLNHFKCLNLVELVKSQIGTQTRKLQTYTFLFYWFGNWNPPISCIQLNLIYISGMSHLELVFLLY